MAYAYLKNGAVVAVKREEGPLLLTDEGYVPKDMVREYLDGREWAVFADRAETRAELLRAKTVLSKLSPYLIDMQEPFNERVEMRPISKYEDPEAYAMITDYFDDYPS